MARLAVIVATVIAVGFVAYRQYLRLRPARGIPPGPKPLPIVGNVMDVPPPGAPEHRHWLKHKDKYGPISSVTIMGRTRVIIHDKQAANYLLDNMSAVTSSKPATVFGYELCGFWRFLAQLKYTDRYRRERKLVHKEMGTKAAVMPYDDVIESEVGEFLAGLLAQPENMCQLIRNEIAAIILKITYGYSADRDRPDPLVDLITRVLMDFSQAFQPFLWPVDTFPVLAHLPEWLPGMGFKETARRVRRMSRLMVDVPYAFVLRQMKNGSHQPSYVSKLVEQLGRDGEGLSVSQEDENAIKYTAGTLYGGGSDTSATAIKAAFLAMILFPEVQRKAQEEIDRVIGNERLPKLADREKLPYLDSTVKEALRWFTIVPMGTAHEVGEDLSYGGHVIPKGSFLSPAVWWFCHDPDVHADPSTFDPARFLEPRNEPDPSGVFGYGRRICVGRFLADSAVFLTIAQTLAVFNIGRAVDEQDVEMEAACEEVYGMISHLADFPSKVVPRGAAHARLVRRSEAAQPREKDSELLDKFTI